MLGLCASGEFRLRLSRPRAERQLSIHLISLKTDYSSNLKLYLISQWGRILKTPNQTNDIFDQASKHQLKHETNRVKFEGN